MLASGKDLERVMAMAAEAAKAAVRSAEAGASAEIVAAATAASALVEEVPMLQHGSTPTTVESGGESGTAEAAPPAQAKAAATALRRLLMV